MRNAIKFDGTEAWRYDSTYNRYRISAKALYNSKINKQANILCNYFKYDLIDSNKKTGVVQDVSSSEWYFHISDKDLNGKTFKEWVIEKYNEGSPLTVEYDILDEKLDLYIEEYTEEQQAVYNKLQKLLLYKHYNYIECLDEVNCKMKLTYRPDKFLSLQNQIDEIKAQMATQVAE